MSALDELADEITSCRQCPRLVEWREEVARVKRAAFRDQEYWGKPVPGFGAEAPGILIVGLAPAAHGANRTGRMFTGDRSGDWLFASLFRVGLANQPTAVSREDGLQLHGVRLVAPVRCAPPQNKPTTQERDTCAPWLDAELDLVLPSVRVVVTLGGFGWQASLRALSRVGAQIPRPTPKFTHGAEAELALPNHPGVLLLGCYHVSQQNTFTGRLTEPMLDEVLGRAAEAARLRA
ncbi:uracil-DNA glycosylase [Nocardioides sp.]|uniref:uracil-DNA glycosylase n=1 Tax=Nocardioides sp. TaxID=35761 RepID=UPI00356934FB